MQRERGLTSHLVDHQAGQSTPIHLGKRLAAAIPNAVPTLAYE